MQRRYHIPALFLRTIVSITCIFVCCVNSAIALIITLTLETIRVPNVTATPISVDYQNSYTTPVVVCTYALPSDAANEAAVRLDSVGTSSFDVYVERPPSSADVTAGDVYCIISEEGTRALPDGRIYEAHTVESTGTNGRTNWGGGIAENVSTSITGAYPAESRPIVLGQVMTSNDDELSSFWSYDCENRGRVPFQGDGPQTNIQDGICVGKHVSHITGVAAVRDNETLGYMVIAQNRPAPNAAGPIGNFLGIDYRVQLGSDSIRGVDNSPPYSYTFVGEHYDFGAATQEAEDGGDGSWAVLYGTDPLAGSAIDLAVDEETLSRGVSRAHTHEQVGYWLFAGKDYGDAPAAFGVAEHAIIGVLSIGETVSDDSDAEAASQHTPGADGDDTVNLVTGAIDDEDGVSFGQSAASHNTIFAYVDIYNPKGLTVNVCGWLNRPDSGNVTTFDSGDGDCTSTTSTGQVELSWAGMPDDAEYQTFVRVRATSNAMDTSSFTGTASDGEVEDYALTYDLREDPTFASINDVRIQSLDLEHLMTSIGVADFSYEQLREFAVAWLSEPSIDITAGDSQALIDALTQYLDPDNNGRVAAFSWETLQERGTIGFYAQRQNIETGEWLTIHKKMLPGLINAPMGGQYRLLDPTAEATNQVVLRYRLIEQEAAGKRNTYGPYTLELSK